MVVDTSAILAFLQNEDDAELYETALSTAQDAVMSAATALECSLVLEQRYGIEAASRFDALLRDAAIELVAFDAAQWALARSAFRRFGRGKHPAKLNFGDCFAYALAKCRGDALLYKGRDFAQTDITSALAP